MRPVHLIHELDFDFTYSSRTISQDALKDWVQDKLLAVIDEVLNVVTNEMSELCDRPSLMRRLYSIEIDLGPIPQSQFQSELERRLRRELGTKLRTRLALEEGKAELAESMLTTSVPTDEELTKPLLTKAVLTKTRGGVGIETDVGVRFSRDHSPTDMKLVRSSSQKQTVSSTELATLEQFLTNGQLPWEFSEDRLHAHLPILQKVLDRSSDTAPLIQLIRNSLLCKRLVLQYKTPYLFQLLNKCLAPWPPISRENILNWVALELVMCASNNNEEQRFWEWLLPRSINAPMTFYELLQNWAIDQQRTVASILSTYRHRLTQDHDLPIELIKASQALLAQIERHFQASPVYKPPMVAAQLKQARINYRATSELRPPSTNAHGHPLHDDKTDINLPSTDITPHVFYQALLKAELAPLQQHWKKYIQQHPELVRQARHQGWPAWQQNFPANYLRDICMILQADAMWLLERLIAELSTTGQEVVYRQCWRVLLESTPDSLSAENLLAQVPALMVRIKIVIPALATYTTQQISKAPDDANNSENTDNGHAPSFYRTLINTEMTSLASTRLADFQRDLNQTRHPQLTTWPPYFGKSSQQPYRGKTASNSPLAECFDSENYAKLHQLWPSILLRQTQDLKLIWLQASSSLRLRYSRFLTTDQKMDLALLFAPELTAMLMQLKARLIEVRLFLQGFTSTSTEMGRNLLEKGLLENTTNLPQVRAQLHHLLQHQLLELQAHYQSHAVVYDDTYMTQVAVDLILQIETVPQSQHNDAATKKPAEFLLQLLDKLGIPLSAMQWWHATPNLSENSPQLFAALSENLPKYTRASLSLNQTDNANGNIDIDKKVHDATTTNAVIDTAKKNTSVLLVENSLKNSLKTSSSNSSANVEVNLQENTNPYSPIDQSNPQRDSKSSLNLSVVTQDEISSYPKFNLNLQQFHAWRKGELSIAAAELSLEHLKQWLYWWFIHDSVSKNQDCNLLLEAITARLADVSMPEFFLKSVLRSLHAGAEIDLDTLEQQAQFDVSNSVHLMFCTEAELLILDEYNTKVSRDYRHARELISNDFPATENLTISPQKISIIDGQLRNALLHPREFTALLLELHTHPAHLKLLNYVQLQQILQGWFAQEKTSDALATFISTVEFYTKRASTPAFFLLRVLEKLWSLEAYDLEKIGLTALTPHTIETKTKEAEPIDLPAIAAYCEQQHEQNTRATYALTAKLMEYRQVTESAYIFQAATNPTNPPPNLSPIALRYFQQETTTIDCTNLRLALSQWCALYHADRIDQSKVNYLEDHCLQNYPASYFLCLFVCSLIPLQSTEQNQVCQQLVSDFFRLNYSQWADLRNALSHDEHSQRWQQSIRLCFVRPTSLPMRGTKVSKVSKTEKISLLTSSASSLPPSSLINLTQVATISTWDTVSAQAPIPVQTAINLPQLIARAFLGFQLESLSSIWPQILSQHVDLLHTALKQYANRDDAQNRLLSYTRLETLQQMVTALAPASGEILQELWTHWTSFSKLFSEAANLHAFQTISIKAAINYYCEQPIESPCSTKDFLRYQLKFYLSSPIAKVKSNTTNSTNLRDLARDFFVLLEFEATSKPNTVLYQTLAEIAYVQPWLEQLNFRIRNELTKGSQQAIGKPTDVVSVKNMAIEAAAPIQTQHFAELAYDLALHYPQQVQTFVRELAEHELNNTVLDLTEWQSITAGLLRHTNALQTSTIWSKLMQDLKSQAVEPTQTSRLYLSRDAMLEGALIQSVNSNLQLEQCLLILRELAQIELAQPTVEIPANQSNNASGIVQISPHDGTQLSDTDADADTDIKTAASTEKWRTHLPLLLQSQEAITMADQLYLERLVRKFINRTLVIPDTIMQSTLSNPVAIERLVYLLPNVLLHHLLLRLTPEIAEHIPALITRIQSALPIHITQPDKILWQMIFQALFIQNISHSVRAISQELVRRLASADGKGQFKRWLALLDAVTDETKQARTAESLTYDSEHVESSKHSWQDRTTKTNSSAISVHQRSGEQGQTTHPRNEKMASPIILGEAHLQNGGMVIIAPYIQRLFQLLDLTNSMGFVDTVAAQRGVHILQYAVTGEQETPEYQLVLNKLLCGIHGGIPLQHGITATAKEKEVVEQMLHGVIANWSALGTTSIQGLRETFLQRPAHLLHEEDAWQLKIQTGTFDMLLDQLPWSFTLIKLPWMTEPLHVTWRQSN
jgi:hypothetical protein